MARTGVPGFAMNCHKMLTHFKIQKSRGGAICQANRECRSHHHEPGARRREGSGARRRLSQQCRALRGFVRWVLVAPWFVHYEITGVRPNISSIFFICSLLNRPNSIAWIFSFTWATVLNPGMGMLRSLRVQIQARAI